MPRRFFLADELDRRPGSDPDLRMVVLMCDYAGQILRRERPGPYSDADACRYARGCLIPAELLDRPDLDPFRAARWLDVPTRARSRALDA
jgi:hypothetical protein